ncbi:MAG: GNAT family N-acetyltransferase, partial [Pseudonocardiaceae bacterium]
MSKHFLELISLWVAPFAHGHGAGDSAVRRALAWAPIEHGRRPVVLSVKTNTDPAIQL